MTKLYFVTDLSSRLHREEGNGTERNKITPQISIQANGVIAETSAFRNRVAERGDFISTPRHQGEDKLHGGLRFLAIRQFHRERRSVSSNLVPWCLGGELPRPDIMDGRADAAAEAAVKFFASGRLPTGANPVKLRLGSGGQPRARAFSSDSTNNR